MDGCAGCVPFYRPDFSNDSHRDALRILQGGHCCWEVVYVTVLGRDFTTVEDDLLLLRTYHSNLQQQLITHQALVEGSTDYSWERFYEEYCTA
eukprot:COSAG05_NODE_16431_length_346_cov_0.838057_2_plen_92_part_01